MSTFKRKAREKTTRLLGYRAQYLHFECKTPKATVVCFHGWLDNAASFIPLAEHLSEYEIFAFDFLGHGKSEHRHAGERYHYVDLVAFVDAALGEVHAEKVVLVGHSMGAGACALYAGSAEHDLYKLVLIEGYAPMTSEASEAARILREGIADFKKVLNLRKPRYDNFFDAVKVRMRINGLREETAIPLVKRALHKIDGAYTWRADFRLRAPSLLRFTEAQVMSILSEINIQTQIILGDNGMDMLKFGMESKQAIFAKASWHILPGHHHLHMDEANAVADAMRGFIDDDNHKK